MTLMVDIFVLTDFEVAAGEGVGGLKGVCSQSTEAAATELIFVSECDLSLHFPRFRPLTVLRFLTVTTQRKE